METETSRGKAGKADNTTANEMPTCPGLLYQKVAQAVRLAKGSDTPAGLVETDHNSFNAVPLRQGPQIFAAIADLIASARSDVVLESWAWDSRSDAAAQIFDGIRRLSLGLKARPGKVTVRLLINQTLQASPSIAEIHRHLEKLDLDPRLRVIVAAWKAGLLGANHAKVVVVDASRAIITGANVERANDSENPQWDFGYRMEGDVALALHRTFATAWRQAEIWTCGGKGPFFTAEESCWDKQVDELPWPSRVVQLGDRAACGRALVATHPARNEPWPGDYDNAQAQAFLTAVAGAEHVVRMQTPNLNDPRMMERLVQAARRGVELQIVLSKAFNESIERMPGRGGGNQETVDKLYKQLSAHPAALGRLKARWYSVGGHPVQINGPPNSHTKYLSVDSALTIVGSGNQDVQSYHNSREVNVVICDPSTVRAWEQTNFDPVFASAVPASPSH